MTKIKYNCNIIPKPFIGITLYPNIYLKYSKEEMISNWFQQGHDWYINHEKIHLAQQKELSLFKTNTFITDINFYILYSLNWLLNVLSLVRSKTAYKDICFEREAYKNGNNLEYLKTRKKFNWINHIL